MFYITPNLATKQQLRDAIANGTHVTVFKVNQDIGLVNGKHVLTGPNFRAGIKWYANAEIVDNKVVAVMVGDERIELPAETALVEIEPEPYKFAEPYAYGEAITGFYG